MDLNFIASMFAHEIAPASIARAVGVTEARINQLAEHSKFAKLVANKRLELLRQMVERVETAATLEDKVLEQLVDRVALAETRDLIALLKVTLEGKQPKVTSADQSAPVVNLVFNNNVDLSKLQKPKVQLNANREVTSVSQRSLTPMSSDRLESIIGARAANG